MSKVRIYELAKELGISNKDMLTKLHEQGIEAHNHMNSLEDGDVQKIRSVVKGQSQPKPEPQQAAPAPSRPQGERPQGDRPQGDRPQGDRPQGDRPQGARPQGDRPQGDRPQGDRPGYQGSRPQGDRPQGGQYRPAGQGDRPQGDRPGYQGNRPQGQRPQGGIYKPMSPEGASQGDRPQGDRPQGDRPGYQGNRPQGDRPGYQGNRPQGGQYRPAGQGDRPQGDRPQGDRPGYQGNRPQGDRPQGDRPGYQGNRPQGGQYRPAGQGDRPQGDRPQGDRPGYQGNRPQGDRPGYQGNRPQGDRPGYQGNRPQGDRPGYQGNRPQGDRPGYQGNRPQGDRPGYQGNRPQGDRPGYQGNRPPGDRPQGGGYGNRPQGGGYGSRPQGQRSGGLNIPAAPLDKKEAAPLRKQRTTSQYNEDSNRAKQDRLKNEKKKTRQDIRVSINDYDDDGNPYPKLRTSNRRKNNGEGGPVHSHEKKSANKGTEALLIPERMTVADFAVKMNRQPKDLIVKLMGLGIMAGINHELDFETMELLAVDFGIEVQQKTEENIEKQMFDFEDDEKDMVRRAPVVTVMGHVDHGKTSLLDAIRNTSITSGEAGGITQHIGASEVEINGQKIVFLDTPGHEAFTTLRARGSKITDIAILVVAADDGVMPQTIEAIDHAKAAGIPIIVAVNKIDKPGANPDKVKQELAGHGVQVEEWGGETVSCLVSAKVGTGIDNLLEMVLLVAEMQNLNANPNRPGNGSIIEAHIDKGRGPVATVLVQNGTLNEGDTIIAGATYGRIRAMFNDKGKRIKSGGPSTSAEILGLSEAPQAGDKFYVVQDEKKAKQLAERRQQDYRELGLRAGNAHVTLEDLFSQIQQGNIKELNLILKADVHGSLEALKTSLLKLSNEEVRVNIIHASIGTISESDILLASASNALIIGFNVRPTTSVAALAEKEQVDVRTYQIIYNAINDIETAMKGMLDPIFKEVVLGKVEVRATFKVPKLGLIAGAYVLDGKVTRTAKVRVVRDGIIIHDGKISSLKRFKDDVKEVATGYECGIGIDGYNDLKEQDLIEAYIMEEVKRS